MKITSPYSFSAYSKGKKMTFQVFMKSHNNAFIDLGVSSIDAEFVLLFIPNKRGDNFVVMKAKDLDNVPLNRISFEELAKVIKRKTRFEYDW